MNTSAESGSEERQPLKPHDMSRLNDVEVSSTMRIVFDQISTFGPEFTRWRPGKWLCRSFNLLLVLSLTRVPCS